MVDFKGDSDPMDPKAWPLTKKWIATAVVGTTGFLTCWASAIDASVSRNIMDAFGVSRVVSTLATSVYLVGFGIG